ncbi:MAG: hypothetical protein LBS49_09775 [Candidatus Accumulibacter sp.]|nr:hypothetical protein [Accumulibacter sp.]
MQDWPPSFPLPHVAVVDYDINPANEDDHITRFSMGDRPVEAFCHREVPEVYEFLPQALSPRAVLDAIGDGVQAEEEAREIPGRLSRETAAGRGCWTISTVHLSAEGERYLAELADHALAGFLFVAFRIPRSFAIGVKLLATPWTDAHLRYVENIGAEELRRRHRCAGVPDALANVRHWAARGGVRVLIFDAEAPVLDELPVYDDL